MAEQTDPSQPQPPAEVGEGQRSMVDTLAEAQALAALDEMIAKVDSVGEASQGGAAAGPEGQEPPREAYALTGDVPPMDGWYVAMKDNAQGPLTVDDLKDRWSRGEIGADTLCWREGMSEWRQLSRLHALTSAIVPRPREGLKALSAKPPVRSQPSTFAPNASKMLKSLAQQEQEVQTDRLVGAAPAAAPATPAAPAAARPPTGPTTPEGPKRVQPPAVKPAMFAAERDEEEDEDQAPRRAAGVSGGKLFFSLFAASVLGGVVGGSLVKMTMPPPPAPVVVHEPMPSPPPPPAPAAPPASPPPAAAAQPPAAPAKVEVKPRPASHPGDDTGEAATKTPPAPKKPPPPKTKLDKDFQDAFGQ